MRRGPLRRVDVERLAHEYDNAPDVADECLLPLWEEYALFALERQRQLVDEFEVQLVSVADPYKHGSNLLADLVRRHYKVPAPTACPGHPAWDGVRYAAARTWHDIAGHGYGGVGFTLEEEIQTYRLQADELCVAGKEHLVVVVFSDTMQQLCSTLFNHAFAPQKVVCTEFTRLLERCLS
jgi:hypothetical protein